MAAVVVVAPWLETARKQRRQRRQRRRGRRKAEKDEEGPRRRPILLLLLLRAVVSGDADGEASSMLLNTPLLMRPVCADGRKGGENS